MVCVLDTRVVGAAILCTAVGVYYCTTVGVYYDSRYSRCVPTVWAYYCSVMHVLEVPFGGGAAVLYYMQ